MKNKTYFYILAMLLTFFIAFNACQEEDVLANKELQPKGSYIKKVSFNELVKKFGKDTELIQKLQRKPSELMRNDSTAYVFDTANIVLVGNGDYQSITVPAFKMENDRSDYVYSLSIEQTDSGIASYMTTYQQTDTDSIKHISTLPYTGTMPSTARVQCMCTEIIIDFPCLHVDCQQHHQNGGCIHPITFSYTSCSCSGSAGNTIYYGGGPSGTSNTLGSGSPTTVYTTGQIVYNDMRILLYPIVLNPVQKMTVQTDYNLCSLLTTFLTTSGTSINNKNFALAVINAIEDGSIDSSRESVQFLAWAMNYLNTHPTFDTTQAEWMEELKDLYPPQITLDSTLNNTTIDCILKKMVGDTNNDNTLDLPTDPINDNLFQKVLRKFNGINAPTITFIIDNLALGNAVANTTSYDMGVTYTISLSSNIQELSNLEKEAILIHELIHILMLNDWNEWGMLVWPNNGQGIPELSSNIDSICEENNFFSNNKDEYFAALLCIYAQNPTGNFSEWQHEIFNMTIFDVSSYSAQLSNFLNNYHDWNSESVAWKGRMSQQFGSNWRIAVCDYITNVPLQQTSYFNNTWLPYQNIDNYPTNEGPRANFLKFIDYIKDGKFSIPSTANIQPFYAKTGCN